MNFLYRNCMLGQKMFPNNQSYSQSSLIAEGGRRPPQAVSTQFVKEKDIFTNSPYPEAFGKRPMNIVSPLYDQHIIKPPKANVTHGSIHDTEVICSEDRNIESYEKPNQYVVKLKDVYKNVTSVSLMNACIPNSACLINERNNILPISFDNDEILCIEIKSGDYSPEELEVAINSSINTSDICIIYNSCTKKFTFVNKTTDKTLYIYFNNCENTRSIRKVLGFPQKDIIIHSSNSGVEENIDKFTVETSSKYEAPYKHCLQPDCFSILRIRELENIRSNSTPLDRAFAVIPMNVEQNKNVHIHADGCCSPFVKYFNPPLARLDRFTIEFLDKKGNLINFEGLEHYMEFRIHTLNAPGKYNPGSL